MNPPLACISAPIPALPKLQPRRRKSVRQKFIPAAGIALAHVLPLTLFFTGTRWRDWIVFAVLFCGVNYGLGLALHRYFAHRSFRTSRVFQFCLGWLACIFFGDPIGFAGKHRLHHKFADQPEDVHTPLQGIWHCWIGSLLDDGYPEQEILRHARDWQLFPELRFLHRFYFLPALLLMAGLWAVGGYRLFVTGYVLAFLVGTHGPSAVNYLCHRGSRRRFATPDLSTNNWLLGWFLFGEGWHNNHHFYPAAANSGIAWYEVDFHYYTIRLLALLGLVWSVRTVSDKPRANLDSAGLAGVSFGAPRLGN
jgi:stearoyl-CoA desaturase (Delta-9 desaturase)